MAEATLKLPNANVVRALYSKWASNKKQTSSLNGEYAERIQIQEGNTPGYKIFQSTYNKIMNKAEANELAALDMAAMMQIACEQAVDDIRSKGHVGDIAEMAEKSTEKAASGKTGSREPLGKRLVKASLEARDIAKDGLPLDEAQKKFEKTAHLHVVDGGAEKKRGPGRPKKDKGFVEAQREETAKGDALIRQVINGDDEPALPAAE